MCSVFVDLLAYWLVSDLRYGLLVQLYGLRGDLSSIQLLSCVRLFVTPWTAAFQASLSITNSWSLLKFMPLSRWCHPTISSSVAPFSSKACHCFHCFPIYFPWSDGTRFMILVFWMLSFNPTFSLSSCTSVKRLFSSSSLSAHRFGVICIPEVTDAHTSAGCTGLVTEGRLSQRDLPLGARGQGWQQAPPMADSPRALCGPPTKNGLFQKKTCSYMRTTSRDQTLRKGVGYRMTWLVV